MRPDIKRGRVSADTQCIVAYWYWFDGEEYRGDMLEFKHGDHLNWRSDEMMEELYKATFCYEQRSK